jgi:hypothetical protein
MSTCRWRHRADTRKVAASAAYIAFFFSGAARATPPAAPQPPLFSRPALNFTPPTSQLLPIKSQIGQANQSPNRSKPTRRPSTGRQKPNQAHPSLDDEAKNGSLSPPAPQLPCRPPGVIRGVDHTPSPLPTPKLTLHFPTLKQTAPPISPPPTHTLFNGPSNHISILAIRDHSPLKVVQPTQAQPTH